MKEKKPSWMGREKSGGQGTFPESAQFPRTCSSYDGTHMFPNGQWHFFSVFHKKQKIWQNCFNFLRLGLKKKVFLWSVHVNNIGGMLSACQLKFISTAWSRVHHIFASVPLYFIYHMWGQQCSAVSNKSDQTSLFDHLVHLISLWLSFFQNSALKQTRQNHASMISMIPIPPIKLNSDSLLVWSTMIWP